MPQKKAAAKKKTKTKLKTKTKTKTKANVKAKAKTGTKTKAAANTAVKVKATPKGKPGKKIGKKELDDMRAVIMAERQRIIHELGRIEETINDATQGQEGSNQSYSNHLADIGTDYMEQEKNFYYASQEGHYLRSLDEALERIDRGEYGICEMCGDLIGEKRLKAVPSARLCIKCKSESEKTQRGR
jgi:RNA polymerase-binding protein DksA